MKSKAPLVLMEQMIMLLVFALAAALCLQAFVKSDAISQRSERRDRALAIAQDAAEAIRHTGGDFEQAAALLGADYWQEDSLSTSYDGEGNVVPREALDRIRYFLGMYHMETDVPGLGRACVIVEDDETGEELVSFEVCWQEVSAHAG